MNHVVEELKRYLGVDQTKGPEPQQHLPLEQPDPEQHPWAGPCCQCGRTKNDDGSWVTWVCCSCDRKVCRHCTLTMPDGHPDKITDGIPEYYFETWCSEKCRITQEGERELEKRR